MKIAVTGKGGVGKTTFAATLARLYADEGRSVLAADVDPDANLGLALGFEEEEFIGRIGGDEFIAIIKNKHSNVESTIDMMQELLKDTMQKKHFVEDVSFAYGIASSKKHDVKSMDELIELADKKMYECKKNQKENQK